MRRGDGAQMHTFEGNRDGYTAHPDCRCKSTTEVAIAVDANACIDDIVFQVSPNRAISSTGANGGISSAYIIYVVNRAHETIYAWRKAGRWIPGYEPWPDSEESKTEIDGRWNEEDPSPGTTDGLFYESESDGEQDCPKQAASDMYVVIKKGPIAARSGPDRAPGRVGKR